MFTPHSANSVQISCYMYCKTLFVHADQDLGFLPGKLSITMPPQPYQHHCLTTYIDACWGSQLGNAVCEGIQLPLFKFCSMSGAIVMHSRGPICCKANRQEPTLLSSCEAEIQATNMGLHLRVYTWNMIEHLSSFSYPIDDATYPTIL